MIRDPMNDAGRPQTDRMRRSMPFGASGSIHGGLLVWLVIASAHSPRETPQSLYDMEIKPNEAHIVWYNLREKLPDIKPAPAPAPKRIAPPRAMRKFPQTLVSAEKEDDKAPQMIVSEAPPVELPKPLPLPNLVAEAAPPPQPNQFTPPDPVTGTAPPPTLPDAPAVDARANAAANPLEARAKPPEPLPFKPPDKKPDAAPAREELPDAPKVSRAEAPASSSPLASNQPKPQPLAFRAPPPLERPKAPRLTLPEGPAVAVENPSARAAPLGSTGPRPQPKTFHGPPPLERPKAAALTLPEGPAVASAKPSAPTASLGNTGPRPQPKAFQTPPPARSAGAPGVTLPESPTAARSASAEASTAPRIPRGFTAPPEKKATAPATDTIPDAAPALSNPAGSGTESLVIAGLDPAKVPEIPQLPPTHEAGFSAGREERAGPATSNENASLVVPGLTAGGSVPDPAPTMAPAPTPPSAAARLLAELHTPLDKNIPAALAAAAPKATRVSSSPDPRMSGRVVYTMAIQMPNMTSYSGSWMVWYAEHVPEPGAAPIDIRPPVPLHVVHPAYIRSAADDKIEGIVRLAGVIGKDGHMSEIELLSGIDKRLDDSAQEALAKWIFTPAQRSGSPIAVDAVFEVPFRLAPKPVRE